MIQKLFFSTAKIAQLIDKKMFILKKNEKIRVFFSHHPLILVLSLTRQ